MGGELDLNESKMPLLSSVRVTGGGKVLMRSVTLPSLENLRVGRGTLNLTDGTFPALLMVNVTQRGNLYLIRATLPALESLEKEEGSNVKVSVRFNEGRSYG